MNKSGPRQTTPKSLRLQIGLFGRTNVGKSSFLNMVAGQEVAITSDQPGTTTDVVEKVMELLPIGPVVFLDTAGMNDDSLLGEARIERTRKIFHRADVIVLLTEPGIWTDYEEAIAQEAEDRHTPLVILVNKIDTDEGSGEFWSLLKEKTSQFMGVTSTNKLLRDSQVNQFKSLLLQIVPEDFITPPPLVGDLLPKGGHAVFIIPIDIEAPKGRIILPQVQAIRDILDSDTTVAVVKEDDYIPMLKRYAVPPDLVVCDSQVVDRMVAETPEGIKCTTFSTLFARFKGDLAAHTSGVARLDDLRPGDKILIGEACSHHAMDDDIGRVKLPRWIREYLGFDLEFDVYAGRDYPENIDEYRLVIHCGACMITRREMLSRIGIGHKAGVPVTNYGIAISYVKGVLERILEPFPEALAAMDDQRRADRENRLEKTTVREGV